MFDELWYCTRLGRYACFAEGKLWQLADIDAGVEIYRAKVTRRAPSLSGVFADVGGEQVLVQYGAAPLPKEGDTVYISLVERAQGTKRAVCKPDPCIVGRYVIYYPTREGLRYARDLAPAVRKACEARFTERTGCLVRSGVAVADIDAALSELAALEAQWYQITHGIGVGSVYKCPPDHAKTLRLARVVRCDDEALSATYGLLYDADLAARFDRAASLEAPPADGRYRTPEGVELVIEHTEACTVVDVNSHGAMRDMPEDNAALAVNLVAAKEVLRQLCLADVTGVILVDFVSMHARYRELFWKELSDMAAIDERVRLADMTKLGFVEMTRRA